MNTTVFDGIYMACDTLQRNHSHSLLFLLAGVRISAFVSSDDKKPLQKSILGFLNPGKPESGPSQKEIKQPLKENNHLSSSSHIWPLRCQRSEESDEKKAPEEPQQSFFQRARAKRLQLQAAAARTRQQASSGISSPSVMDAHKCAALGEEADNDRAREAGASTSEGVGFSCPVCFRRVETADLSLFNRHIDQCLSASSAPKPSGCAEKGTHRCGVEKADDGEELSRLDPAEERALGSDSIEMAPPVSGNNNASEQSPNSKSPALVCPICLLTQDNDDLIMFNRHVDLCLNQEVLHELQLDTSSPINLPSVPNSKAVGECVCSEYELDQCLQA